MITMWHKIRGMLGSLKALALFVLIILCIFVIFAVQSTYTALINPSDPQPVAISQIVDGTVGTRKYVQVSGYANYSFNYTRTEDGKTTATYFVLLDDNSGHLLVVKAKEATVYGRQDRDVTLSGVLYTTPSELKKLIQSDEAKIRDAGFVANASIYLDEESKPPSLIGSLIITLLLGGICFFCLITFFFPSVVFVPTPLDLDVPQPAEKANPGVHATGKFIKLKQVRPEIVLGTSSRKFENAVANIVPRVARDLLIYIHHIQRTKTYGVTVHKSETDWGAFLNGDNMIAVESGLLYGWKNRRAVRLRYTSDKGKEEKLILRFDYDWAHADAVNLFQKMGFTIETGA